MYIEHLASGVSTHSPARLEEFLELNGDCSIAEEHRRAPDSGGIDADASRATPVLCVVAVLSPDVKSGNLNFRGCWSRFSRVGGSARIGSPARLRASGSSWGSAGGRGGVGERRRAPQSAGIDASATRATPVGPPDVQESSRIDPGGPSALYTIIYKIYKIYKSTPQ